MAKASGDYQYTHLVRLEEHLDQFTAALTDQKQYLDRHTAAMEKLTQAIKQLEMTIRREVSAETRQSSIQLEDLVKLFLEYDINPRYYRHITEHKALKGAETRHTELTRRKPGPRSRG